MIKKQKGERMKIELTIERIKEVVEECLQYYTMGDNKTDKEEKKDFVSRLMMDLDNSNTILIRKDKK
tara:strand:+ start:146 stop:346 length:201 start_codon:yes stop_codon:yes gene_type:complete